MQSGLEKYSSHHAVGRPTVGTLFSCHTILRFRLVICEQSALYHSCHRRAWSAYCPNAEARRRRVAPSASFDITCHESVGEGATEPVSKSDWQGSVDVKQSH